MEQYFDPNHRFNKNKDAYCDPDEIALLNILGTHDSQFEDNGTNLPRGLLLIGVQKHMNEVRIY
jgi:hypothetical protein